MIMAKKSKSEGKKELANTIKPKERGLKTICDGNETLKPYCKSGLQAIKTEYRGKIKVPNTKHFGNSVDFDEALKKDFHDKNRWDYGFEYEGNLIFIEFHPAQTSEIDRVCKKTSFTTDWLKTNCPEILLLPKFEKEARQFYWVSSGNNDVRLTGFGAQAKKLAQNKIRHIGNIFDYLKLKKELS